DTSRTIARTRGNVALASAGVNDFLPRLRFLAVMFPISLLKLRSRNVGQGAWGERSTRTATANLLASDAAESRLRLYRVTGAPLPCACSRQQERPMRYVLAATAFCAGGGSGGLVHTGSFTSLEAATAVGLSEAWPQAVSSGSLAKSTMQPSRL